MHTYDHRVDLLMKIAAETPKREVPPQEVTTDLARMIDADVDVQRLVHDGVVGLAEELADREVWPLSERAGRLRPKNMDAAVITDDSVSEIQPLLDSARRYIYAVGDVPGLDDYLQSRYPEAITHEEGDLRRIDLMTEAYRVESAGGPR